MSFAVEEYRNGVRMGSKVVEDGVELGMPAQFIGEHIK